MWVERAAQRVEERAADGRPFVLVETNGRLHLAADVQLMDAKSVHGFLLLQ